MARESDWGGEYDVVWSPMNLYSGWTVPYNTRGLYSKLADCTDFTPICESSGMPYVSGGLDGVPTFGYGFYAIKMRAGFEGTTNPPPALTVFSATSNSSIFNQISVVLAGPQSSMILILSLLFFISMRLLNNLLSR